MHAWKRGFASAESARLLAVLALMVGRVAAVRPRAQTQRRPSARLESRSRRYPERVRVHVDVAARGKDLREALDRLKARRETVEKKLAELKAEAIALGEPGASPEANAQQRQYEMMIAQRMRTKQRPKVDLPVEMTFSLRFEMPLKSGPIEELILQAEAIKTKIKAADLGGLKEQPKLSPEEEEVEEEMRGMMQRNGEEPKKGEPAIVFIATIQPAEMKKALADAYKKAVEQARTLAEAAGAELGELAAIQSPTLGGDSDDREMRMARYYGREMPTSASLVVRVNEAGSASPGQQTFRVQIHASASR